MANPRNTVDYTDIRPIRATFIADGTTITFDRTEEYGSAQAGLAVNLSASKTVQLVGDGEPVLGQLELVEPDGKCTVRIGGVLTLPGGSGATLTPGSKIVGDLGASSAEGYVRSVAAATLAEVAVAAGKILDASDATAVQVFFGGV